MALPVPASYSSLHPYYPPTPATPYFTVQRILTPTEVKALTTTTGVTLIKGAPGKAYLPMTWIITKLAGPAFTINAAAQCSVGHISFTYYMGITSAGLMDQTVVVRKYRHTSDLGVGGDNLSSYDGLNLGVVVNVGSFTGTGSNVIVQCAYFVMDVL